MKFFWRTARGLKQDIARHQAKEAELIAKIEALKGQDDPMSIATVRAYRRFLNQLQQSKAEVVARIGKDKVKL